MKKSILLITALLGLAVLESKAQETVKPAGARQERPAKQMTPEEQATKETARATEELGLSADQQTQYKAFALERINTNRPIHEKMKATQDKAERKKLHEESKAAKQKFDTSVKGILTPEQQTKWEARKARAVEKKKAHRVERRENKEGK